MCWRDSILPAEWSLHSWYVTHSFIPIQTFQPCSGFGKEKIFNALFLSFFMQWFNVLIWNWTLFQGRAKSVFVGLCFCLNWIAKRCSCSYIGLLFSVRYYTVCLGESLKLSERFVLDGRRHSTVVFAFFAKCNSSQEIWK